jgi:penicillin-binding protein 1C
LRNSSGVTGAAPIFQGVMLAAERRATGDGFANAPVLTATDDSVEHEVCALSGHAANDWCPNKRREWVAAERPLMPCNWHHLSDDGPITVWPAEYRAWAETHVRRGAVRHADVRRAEVHRADVRRAGSEGGLRIVSPANGSTFLIDPTLRREFQTLSLRAVASTPGPIEWSINGRPAGSADADSKISWPIMPGRHRITARDASGRTAETQVVVR